MKILAGKKLAEKILEKIQKEIKKSRLKLRLVVIQIGENKVSEVFIKQKEKTCQRLGIDFNLYKFPRKIKLSPLKKEIKKTIKNKRNSGIIIQLPLPKNIKEDEILNLIPWEKDVDVLGEESIGKYQQGTLPISAPIVCAVSRLLKEYKIKIKGKNVVLIGSGRLVGQPLTLWILRERGTLTIVNEFTKNIYSITKKTDIIISGVGKQNLIKGNMVKKGVIVIDCGSSYKNGRLIGDIHFKSVSKKASYITPVPGGVGPLTVACLLENLVELNT